MNFMSILVEYMSFDVRWFATTPGLLVTAGLVLVIIGAIFLLLSGKKKEAVSNEEGAKEEIKPEVAAQETPNAATVTDAVEEKKEESVVVPAVETVQEAQPVVTQETAPVVENPVVSEPTVPVVENTMSTEPVAPVNETVENLVIDVPAATETEEVKVEEKKEEVVVTPAVDVTPEVTVNASETVSIYGGANPQVTVSAPEEPRQVYGGADPLENTGALPRVEVPSEPVSVPTIDIPVGIDANDSATPVQTIELPAENAQAPVVENKEEKSVTATPTDNVETLEF